MTTILCCRDEMIPGRDTTHYYSFVPESTRVRSYGCAVTADVRMTDVERDALVRKLERRGKLEDGATYKLSDLQTIL